MDKTILAITGVLILFTGLYLMMPEGLGGFSQGSQLDGMAEEGNGLFGRVIERVADMTWHPVELLSILTVTMLVTAGLAVYWKGIQD